MLDVTQLTFVSPGLHYLDFRNFLRLSTLVVVKKISLDVLHETSFERLNRVNGGGSEAHEEGFGMEFANMRTSFPGVFE